LFNEGDILSVLKEGIVNGSTYEILRKQLLILLAMMDEIFNLDVDLFCN
jgi:hypothetical protein